MLPENALAMSREQTRALLLRSLYRANVRQKAVARRRTNLRYVVRLVRRSATAVVAVAGLLWGATALDLVPQVRIVMVDQLHSVEHPDARAVTPPAPAEQPAIDAGPARSALAGQVQPYQGEASGAEDQALPVELKLESQLNSVMQ